MRLIYAWSFQFVSRPATNTPLRLRPKYCSTILVSLSPFFLNLSSVGIAVWSDIMERYHNDASLHIFGKLSGEGVRKPAHRKRQNFDRTGTKERRTFLTLVLHFINPVVIK